MRCRTCNNENRDGVKFCTKCGIPLILICPVCRCAVAEDDIYCGTCGIHLPDCKTKAAKSDLMNEESGKSSNASNKSEGHNAERKTVTVLFGDLSGFTAMSEKLDPEEVTTIMNTCLQIMGDTVVAYEGYIDKFIGDCIMAIFGAPITHENDPELALRAALEMSKKIDEYNKELPIKLEKPLSLHIGVNTGLVVAGEMGSDSRMDYTVMGDTVNLASRLESKATAGQVFISEYTHNQTKNLFEFIEHEPIEVKGKREPVSVFQVVRPLDDSEIQSSTTIEIPMVGRNEEIELLATSVDRLQNGEGQAVFLISDPGFGKSRIHSELKKRYKQEEFQFIEGRCHSYGRNTPYHTFIDIFKHLCAIDAEDMHDTMVQKLTEGLPLLLGEDKDVLSDAARNTMVLIGRLLDLDLSERFEIPLDEMSTQEIHTATIRSIGWAFAAFGKYRPTVLSIEDLHNADTVSVEVIGSLIAAAKDAPIMLLLMLRPDRRSASYKLLPLARRVLGDRAIEMTFERLTRTESEAFVKYLLETDDLPSELFELVGSRSDGNPLFLQEIVHSLQDIGAVKKCEDGLKVLKDLSAITIPNSLTGIIISRFDQLTVQQREILSKASVIGPIFSRRQIFALITEGSVDADIDALKKAEMIFESQSFPEIEYSFHTTFIQEAIYDTLLLKRRRALHLEVATTIKNLCGDRIQDQYESLAYHYNRANDMSNAYEFMVLSGMKAKTAFANRAAERFLKQAIEIGLKLKDPKPAVCELCQEYSEVLELLGDMDGAIDAWKKAIELIDDVLMRANALRNIGRIEEKRGSKESAIDIYKDAIEGIKDYPESTEYGLLLMNLSWVLNRFHRTDEALESATLALNIFETKASKENIALCCNNIAVFYEEKNDLDVALEYNLKSLNLFKELKNRRQIANVELSLGYLRTKRDEMDLALEHFTRSAEAMDRIGNVVGSATALLAKGRSYADIGRYDEAEISLLSALHDFRDMGIDRRIVATLISLINVLLNKKETKDAFRYIEEAQKIAKADDFKADTGKLMRLSARALRIDNNEKGAEKNYKKAFDIFTKLGREQDAKIVEKEWKGQ